jgi:hypothetical protein
MDTIEQNRQQRQQQYNKMRSWMDYAMGVLILAGGAFIFFHKKLGVDFEFKEPLIANIFGGVCLVYGLWRLYRGYNKR